MAAMLSAETLTYAKSKIRDIPDFPSKGIVFKDITPLLADPRAFHIVLDSIAERFIGAHVDAIVGVEARGFIFGGALAARLNASFVPARKPGKLPAAVDKVSYTTEYSTAELEIHKASIRRGARVVIVDDVLATGGTAQSRGEPRRHAARRGHRLRLRDRARVPQGPRRARSRPHRIGARLLIASTRSPSADCGLRIPPAQIGPSIVCPVCALLRSPALRRTATSRRWTSGRPRESAATTLAPLTCCPLQRQSATARLKAAQRARGTRDRSDRVCADEGEDGNQRGRRPHTAQHREEVIEQHQAPTRPSQY